MTTASFCFHCICVISSRQLATPCDACQMCWLLQLDNSFGIVKAHNACAMRAMYMVTVATPMCLGVYCTSVASDLITSACVHVSAEQVVVSCQCHRGSRVHHNSSVGAQGSCDVCHLH
ncbi:hypothetical protein ABBQ32_011874 [Trebouxia sp. C0010 RCD-2024]